MPCAQTPKSLLHDLSLSKKEILALDPQLFSADEKQAYIDLLYGTPDQWSWKRDLESAASNLRRWNLLLSQDAQVGTPYRVGHTRLLSCAKNCAPKKIGRTVTDFTDWIFRMYVPEKDYGSLVRGQLLEREIAARRIPVPIHSRWKLIFSGMSDGNSPALAISKLTINGVPLRGKPDLVFREKGTKRILIVEVKTSEADIPANGWPNMRAQLWAYSKIDLWSDADEILLAGEVWGFKDGLRLHQSIHWHKNDKFFEQENAELFSCYRNHCESLLTPS